MATYQPAWDKSGSIIEGKYMGIFPYTGIIDSTRVCYGTDIQYRVILDNPIIVYGREAETLLIRKERDQGTFVINKG